MSERHASEHRGDRTSASFHGRVEGTGGGRRGRGPVIVVAWVVGLCGLVGFGALGGQTAPRGDPAALEIAPSSVSPAPIQRQIALDQPARRGEVITTRELIVRGRVARSAGQVRIMLESSNGKPLAIAAVDPTGYGHGGWIPFESRFRISMPRPGGDMLVFVVALDSDGIPIDAMRRRFKVGAIVEIPLHGQ